MNKTKHDLTQNAYNVRYKNPIPIFVAPFESPESQPSNGAKTDICSENYGTIETGVVFNDANGPNMSNF